ncbi:HAMP domain-containing sensor histidine kinase [Paenibacillus apii]|uniref:HAMP domain-containing sensor histidine kinase n=1 Tax=Paenibacillus apii TaxID=1850370 RepID=UPI001438EDC1|nr:HAMP domain-containing sensor histidine kinase [Paenibacillus apii]NJJ38415.1 HAMP domain-containing protein [Paenibacillus apii]
MFRKSLRLQIIAIFVAIVFISLFIAFTISRLFSMREVAVDQPFLKIAEDAASLWRITAPEYRDRLPDILSHYHVQAKVVEERGNLPFSLSAEEASPLFDKELKKPVFLNTKEGPIRFIGVPDIDGAGHSMILKVDFSRFLESILKVLLIGLISVLLIGILLILLTSRYLVEPVSRLTGAAREMAKGNLSYRLAHRRKDEIGTLMDSFNDMASELQNIDKIREDFVINVSHEIQSPLTSIRGFTRAMRDGVIPAEQQKEHLDIIYEETLRLSRLSENLLRLASLDSEHHPFHPVTYRLDEQLRRVILVSEPLWTEKNLDVELNLHICSVTADRDLLEQVWQNLIANAIRYSDANSLIEVSMEKSDQAVDIHIKNTGKGIPDRDLSSIFERFYRVDKARTRSTGGNGLGLSIVKKIIELHHYKIAVKSEEGKETCFTVSIPL